MTNLLPQEKTQDLHNELLIRLLVVLSVFIFFSLLLFIVVLVPSYFLSKSRLDELHKTVDVFQKSVAFREANSTVDLLNMENAKINILKEDADFSVVDLIKEINAVKPSGIKINGVFYDNDSLNIAGIASNRETLISFINNLDKSDRFSNADFPVSSLTKSYDIDFSLSVKLKK